MALSTYLEEASDLLHDSMNLFTGKRQLTRWVNVARRNAAKRTGCIQRLITGQSAFGASAQPFGMIPGAIQPGALPGAFPNAASNSNAAQNGFQTIVGSERIPYQGFANGFLQAQHAGCKAIIDVASIAISWGGACRPSPTWMPWEDLQAYARAYTYLIEDYPIYWSVLNDGENGEVWLWPDPSVAAEMEWTVYAVPSDLYTDSDYDAIPGGFRDAIKFGAASLSYMTSRQFIQAQLFEDLFAEALGIDRVAVDRGKQGNFYYSVP